MQACSNDTFKFSATAMSEKSIPFTLKIFIAVVVLISILPVDGRYLPTRSDPQFEKNVMSPKMAFIKCVLRFLNPRRLRFRYCLHPYNQSRTALNRGSSGNLKPETVDFSPHCLDMIFHLMLTTRFCFESSVSFIRPSY